MPHSLQDLNLGSPTDAPPQPLEESPTHASRRAVLGGVAGLGAIAAVTAVGSTTGLPSLAAPAPATDSSPAAGATIIAHVRPGSRDEVTLYSGDAEVTVTDRALVQALQAALGTR